MVWKDRLAGLFVILFSGVSVYLALNLPLGKAASPGPGLFPLILSITVGLLALPLLLGFSQSDQESKTRDIPSIKWKVIYLLGNLGLYAFLFRPLGFLISTSIFLIILKPIINKKWALVLPGAVFTSIGLFLFFNYLLRVELPMGILAK